MAIAFDSVTEGDGQILAHTNMGSNVLLFVSGFYNTSDGTLTGMSYNGNAMTLVGSQATGGSPGTQTSTLWYLAIGIGDGISHNVVASGTDTTPTLTAVSYTGCSQTGIPDAISLFNAGLGTSISGTISPIGSNCWVCCSVRDNGGAALVNNSGILTTNRGADKLFWDSNGTVSTGSNTIAFTGPSGSGWAVVAASFAPGGVTPVTAIATHNFNLLGVGS